ncbi:hypothetical protein G6O67_003971 [Ophiocordyceps sinensis]|uniref:Rho-GAP domain-containing protein n=1 Tax=Ophiocordyceps sinensis TaxID=72228 RepID=A0A8H4LXU6_9HYPO|nr:hypothetical protein G6O67_003971 [Ophiocordyceps sinensis]
MASIPTTHRVNNHAPPPGATPASPPNKRDLKSWWKSFKLPLKHQEPPAESKAPGIFGVPLRQSITYANVAISLIDEHGQSYIYGYVPIVVAKCGVFLKEKATGIEGIFRLSGSEKRIKELKHIFDSPDRYGKGLVWDGYTVHDAANVLRRYLNDLPEPVVPLDLYEKFRDPLRGATKQAVGDAEGPQFVDNFDEMAAIEKYQKLITELPPLNRQLLLYILDLLAVFAAKSDENRMNSQNLAAIFQPGMLSHPTHAMAPEEYRLNQCVLIFLIENQDHFLIGMQGTAADEKTMKEVALGTPTGPLTPNLNKTSGLDRSSSNASAGATSVRRDGKVRRNRSVSSRHSRQEGNATPNSPLPVTTPTGGLGRSNTVPSKKSPALAGAKFKRNDGSGRHSPAHLEPMTPVRPAQHGRHSQRSSPTPACLGAAKLPVALGTASGLSQERLLEVPQESSTPQGKERNLQSIFQRSPVEGGEKRQPNKLKKKRIPSGINISAQSSSVSKRRWRLSRSRKDDNGSTNSSATPPHLNIGSNENAEISTTSIGSGISKPRNSVTNEGSEPTTLASVEAQASQEGGKDNGKDDAKGPIGWIRNKYREAKESAEQRRNKSPPADRQALGAAFISRGRSLDLKRDKVDERQPEREATTLKEAHQPPASKEVSRKTSMAAVAEAPPGAHAETHKPNPVDASKEVFTEPLKEPRAELTPVPRPERAPATIAEAQAHAEPPKSE